VEMKKIVLACFASLAFLGWGCERKDGAAPAQPAAKGADEATPAETTAPVPGRLDANNLSGGATVSGVVKFEGTPPRVGFYDMSAKPECVALHGDKQMPLENLTVNENGTLQNAVVYVKRGAGKYLPFKEPVVLDQIGCTYVPHVWGMMVDQDLLLKNTDGFLHNVLVTENRSMNESMPTSREILKPRWFKKPELGTTFSCAVHAWMRGFACIFEHPFYSVTGQDGKFEIKHLPPGKYTLAAWHRAYPKLKTPADVEIEVAEGDAKTQEFTFVLGN
jgi:hypothetical protein